MPDPYRNEFDPVWGPSDSPAAIVPHDVNALANVPKGIYVGGAGTITLRGVNSAADVVFVGVPAGSILPVRPSHVRATGTSATGLVGLY